MSQTAALSERPGPQPMMDEAKGRGEQLTLYIFVIVPFLALIAAVPVVWGWGLGWVDVALFVLFY
ncbi:MAG: acyl-CoA desaturase, partial [Actinomycetota bacterium]|nr:acyl-CoA desaturase [Actinomycetota bacterium]